MRNDHRVEAGLEGAGCFAPAKRDGSEQMLQYLGKRYYAARVAPGPARETLSALRISA